MRSEAENARLPKPQVPSSDATGQWILYPPEEEK